MRVAPNTDFLGAVFGAILTLPRPVVDSEACLVAMAGFCPGSDRWFSCQLSPSSAAVGRRVRRA
jgi:hypothetical protein